MKKFEFRNPGYAQHYQAADINDKIIINLRDINHIMRFLYEGKESQKRILIILNKTGTITQRELTERLGIQPGSASEVIAKLEGAGLILRTLSEFDRRTTDISLTEKGKELADEAVEQRNHRHEEMFSCLSSEEKTQLLSLLEKINADWDQRYRDTEKMSGSPEHHHRHCGHHDGVHRSE